MDTNSEYKKKESRSFVRPLFGPFPDCILTASRVKKEEKERKKQYRKAERQKCRKAERQMGIMNEWQKERQKLYTNVIKIT